jgi:predicted PurR-regulated permease PerM
MSVKDAPGWLRDHSSSIMTAGIILALLYLGRSVLIPLALAIMLSLLVAPLVLALRRLRVGRTASVLIAVVALAVSCMDVATLLGTQVLRIAESLPQYESNIQRKLNTLEELTIGPLQQLTDEASRLTESRASANALPVRVGEIERSPPAAVLGVSVLEPSAAGSHPPDLMETSDNCLGPGPIHGDQYFVSQFVVNFGFGLAIWMSLSILRFPQALLCGILAGVMRFIPYVGVGIAAIFAAVVALAVDLGWFMAVGTVGVFILLDIIVGQLLEPHLYGHATGLSPLSVVVGAIFWSWLWGPAGLILSTPLTLCLLVAGRHTKGLGVLELLLGNARPLTLPQRFYQRALSGDPHEIIDNARAFLKTDSLAAYCDRVMIPALDLARLDAEAGATMGTSA